MAAVYLRTVIVHKPSCPEVAIRSRELSLPDGGEVYCR